MSRSLAYYKNHFFQVRLKNLLQQSPKFYIAIQNFRYRGKRYKRKIISRETDIVIEGYPRSANSFSVKAFKFANGDDYKIATHLHAFPQVVVGVEYKIPTLLLLREPFDCIVSYAALRAENMGIDVFNKTSNIKWLLEDYITFYKNLLPYKDQVVVGVFSDVLQDYGAVLKRVNEKFETNFTEFEHSKENVKEVFSTSKSHLSPSEKREDIKKEFLQQMEALKSSPIFAEAKKLYQLWSN